MSCQNQHNGNCPKYQKKEDYRQALRQYPNLDNPLKDWECNEAEEKTCKKFLAYPPVMTHNEFINKKAEILKDIPKELHNALSGMAWERGHSAGYEEVINYLADLVNELKEPITQLETRIRKEK